MADSHSSLLHIARTLVPLILMLVAGSSSANAPFDYPFRAPDDYFARAQDYPRWADLIARDTAQRAQIDACLDGAAACPASLTGYREVIRQGRALSPERKLRLANRFVNARRWDVERRHGDAWRTLAEFLRDGGDCEDFAIAKYFLLRALGFASDDLRVAITWDLATHAYHAVTLVRIGDGIYILDVDGSPRRDATDYRFYFTINETGIWDHVGSGDFRRGTRHHDRGERL